MLMGDGGGAHARTIPLLPAFIDNGNKLVSTIPNSFFYIVPFKPRTGASSRFHTDSFFCACLIRTLLLLLLPKLLLQLLQLS